MNIISLHGRQIGCGGIADSNCLPLDRSQVGPLWG